MIKKYLYALLGAMTAGIAQSAELNFDFKSPAFSGVGYSSHALTIYQLEENRKQKIKDEQKAIEEKALREYQSTNAYKFKNNLESRIYAQLSKQIADSLFGEGSAGDTEWAESQTPFGDTIKWRRLDGIVYVEVYNSNGDILADFNVPVGEFAF